MITDNHTSWQVVGNIRGQSAPAINQELIVEEVIAKLESTINGRVDSELTKRMPSPQAMREVVMKAVGEAVAALPKPKDGHDGAEGKPGKDGIGIQGPPGPQGPAGIGKDGERGPGPTQEQIDSAAERQFSKYALELERRNQEFQLRLQESAERTLQRAIDKFPAPKDGKDGAAGRDALDIEDIDMSIDDEGYLNVSMQRGEFKKLWRLYIPTVSDKGVYKPENKYLRQNGVSHRGSFWIAQVDNPSEVPGTGKQWRMAVKAGRDAKDGAKGDKGDKGDPGQDLRYK